ncbi:MAG: GNAT family N-acetyltransferase [Polyangiaceae bacterium]|nr:GNAT family N-acetyltransferase [Polyangiaceae bacterium]
MSFRWIREGTTRWDEAKRRIVGGAPPGVFDDRYRALADGALVPCEWWRVEDADARVVGFGWLDVVWGDAEILLAVAPEAERRGVGAFILSSLEAEARSRGLGYLTNVVRATHPRAEVVTRFLEGRGFVRQTDGRLVKRVA